MHWQKSGQDLETCTATTWHQWSRAGLILRFFSLNSSSHFFSAFPPGWTSNKSPALRQCKTLAAMVKKLQILLVLLMSTSCNRNNSTLEKRVYMGYLDSSFTGHEKGIDNLSDIQYFSKGFWNYFIKKFPRSTAIIFYSHITRPEEFIKLKDTTFMLEPGDYKTFSTLYDNLPKTADGSEKANTFLPMAHFESSQSGDKVQVPPLTESISKEYLNFLTLIKNPVNVPIFAFKKEFLTEIELVYK